MNKKKYLIEQKELMKEWNYKRNVGIDPSSLTVGSNKKVWWICEKEHEYAATIKNHINGRKCPYCAGKKVLKGFNDLLTWCINNKRNDLINQYDSLKNKNSMDFYTMGTHQEVYWRCPQNHSYLMKISSKTGTNAQCPFCTNHKLLVGYNDLKTWALNNNKILIKEYSNENDILMDSIFPNSSKKVVWICSVCGKKYVASPNSRVNVNSGCPHCAKRNMTSFPEQAIFYYIKQIYSDAINGYKNDDLKITELDIYIPSIKTAIEYDGKRWHDGFKSQFKEANKFNSCKKHEIYLIRIKEKNENTLEGNCNKTIFTNFNNNNFHELDTSINELLSYLKVENIIVDTKKDSEKILKQYFSFVKKNSFSEKYPEKAKYFDLSKNLGLTPNMFYSNSRDLVWWICENCGKNYKLSINAMANRRTNLCSDCAKKQSGKSLKKRVYQYDLNGNFIQLFESITTAELETKTTNISKCCNRKCKTAGGFIWRYSSDCDDIKDYIKQKTISVVQYKKKVIQYSLDRKIIKVYESASSAERENNFPRDSVANCCRKNKKIYKGFIWEYLH